MTIKDLPPWERHLLIDLADWCEDFFNSPDGEWAQEAASILRRLTNSKKGQCGDDFRPLEGSPHAPSDGDTTKG